MPVDVSVIIVSYNARELLGRCLDSVLEQAGTGCTLETIVVDNDSSDGSAQFVREHYPQVRVIEAGRNGGMAFGNNVGMLAAAGRTFLLLNSDAFLEPGALRTLLERLQAHPRAALAAPRLLNEDRTLQRSVRGFPTLWRLATEFLYLRKLAPRSRMLNAFYGGGFGHDREATVEWVMGAAMLVRREAVDELGLMNEAYFMYAEEVDWQRRMHDAGWQVLFVPDAQVVHLGGGSSRKEWGRMYQLQVASHVKYMAQRRGEQAARRVRALLSLALLLRSWLYRLLALLPGERRAQRRSRADGFASARRALAALDPAALAREQAMPAWPARTAEAQPAAGSPPA